MNPTQKPWRILFAEDDELVRMVTGEALTSAGYEVFPVPDGDAAWRALPTLRPDLILSDVRMPNMDGFELLQRVRRHPEYNQLPFIILSAKADTADLRMGMSLGADDYVTKPFDPPDLTKTVAVRLERAAAINQNFYLRQRFLTSVLPHELRTPLTGIMGYADLLKQVGEAGESLSPADLIDYGSNIMRSGERLLRMAEDFALWSWLESQADLARERGAVKISEHEVSLPVLRAVAQDVAGTFGRLSDVSVTCASASVAAVEDGLQRVLRHLIENAFKFSLPGTPVDITGAVIGNEFELTVNDRGRGMTSEQLMQSGAMRQFGRDRFEQQGLGMGLAIARSYARLSGGAFEVAARTPDPGLTVRLALPLAPPAK